MPHELDYASPGPAGLGPAGPGPAAPSTWVLVHSVLVMTLGGLSTLSALIVAVDFFLFGSSINQSMSLLAAPAIAGTLLSPLLMPMGLKHAQGFFQQLRRPLRTALWLEGILTTLVVYALLFNLLKEWKRGPMEWQALAASAGILLLASLFAAGIHKTFKWMQQLPDDPE